MVKIALRLKNLRYWLEAKLSFGMLWVLRLLPMERAISLNAILFQALGPMLPRQKVVIYNLTKAFPEKSSAEIQKIAKAMWRNMGRLVAEYVYFDRLFDGDLTRGEDGKIVVEGEHVFDAIKREGKPCIFFTGHIGNFELLPICAAALGLEVKALFRPPNNPYVAERLLAARKTSSGNMVPAKSGAAWGLARALENGTSIGVLVDQKFRRGTFGEFFGRPVQTNPLLAKLARQFDVPVYPAHCVRLSGGRFKLTLSERLELPRDDNGVILLQETGQLLNDTVEKWVRANPEQWMWMHRRWEVSKKPVDEKRNRPNARESSKNID